MADWDSISKMAEHVPAIENRRILLGFMSEKRAIRKMESARTVGTPVEPLNEPNAVEDADREAAYSDLWEDARDSIGDPPAPYDADEVELRDVPVQDGVEEHLDAFVNDDHFQASFGSIADDRWDIKMVPIESLVSYQRSVTKTAYQESVPSAADDIVELLEIALPTDNEPLVEEQRIRGEYFKGWQFVSRSPNMRVSGPYLNRPDDDDTVFAALTFELTTDPNFLYVAQFEDRYILKNGYHRTYQLMRAGETHIPAVVLETDSFRKTGAKQGSFDRELVMGDRPPMLPDYDSEIAVDIQRRAKNRVLRIIAEKTDILR